MEKSLDRKLAEIRRNYATRTFILADAKDADMAFGIASTGPRQSPEMHPQELRFRGLEEYRQAMRDVTAQGLVDIMLMSASSNEQLTIQERLFDASHVTPAARANDTSDIHVLRGGVSPQQPARPFRTATIDHIQCGKAECAPEERILGANLGLYSITFNNDPARDLETLNAFKRFRLEAEAKGFRYFLEVFDPNVPSAVAPEKIGQFVNDAIVRALAGVTERGRPLFLKMVYHGPKAMEELVNYDPTLIPGVLGGAAGTTYDAFKLIAEAQKYGARVALFGRKINNAEHQLAFVEFLRLVVDGVVSPEEAVRAYHGVLQGLNLKPKRSLEDDMRLTTDIISYRSSAVASPGLGAPKAADAPRRPDGAPDFSRMTPAEKIEWNQRERDRVFG
ncbi:MAG: hypothetical protein NTW86_25200 [Candidatus Sumerlaeota bacterium]|nr:hypothetical protein [Candidatus Sumerlaeota bacterium]